MKQIPSNIKNLYDRYLIKKAIPKTAYFLYRKWLRYYLDFCEKYDFNQLNKKSLNPFVNKLENKGQTEQQRKQAYHAVSLFYELGSSKSEKDALSKNKKGDLSTKKDIPKPINVSWVPVYDGLTAEIKLRHYSPKTLKSYRSWIRKF